MQPFVFVEVVHRPKRSDFPWVLCQKNMLLLLTRTQVMEAVGYHPERPDACVRRAPSTRKSTRTHPAGSRF